MADAPPPPPPPPSPPPALAGGGDPSTSSAPAPVPRTLPSTLLVVPSHPSSSGRARGARGGRATGSGRLGGGGRRKAVAHAPASTGARGRGPDRLVDAVRVVGRDVEAGVAGADILELAMAKGPMFTWLSYWPEEGFPKERHPY